MAIQRRNKSLGKSGVFPSQNMVIFLASLAAVTAQPDPSAVTEISVRCLSFTEASMELAFMDRKDKPVVFEARNQSLSHELRVPCKEQKFVVYHRTVVEKSPAEAAAKNGEPETVWTPLATATLPASGTRFIAILHREGNRDQISLIADPEDENAGGSMRFFNLCQHQIGLNFPGGNYVLDSGKDTVIRPKIAHEDYGQGQIFSPMDGTWRLSGGMRWLQLNDIRTIWFVLPTPGAEGTVMLRGIEEKIAQPVNTTTPAEASSTKAGAMKAGLDAGKPHAKGKLASSG